MGALKCFVFSTETWTNTLLIRLFRFCPIQTWSFLISSFLALLGRHSCQDRNTDTPSNALPTPSGISYESLHYPLAAAEQQYQAVPPLTINTGRIPLIRHAVHAPMQYFTSNTGNRRTSAEAATTRRSAPRREHRRPTATAAAIVVGTAAATTIASAPQNGSPTTTTTNSVEETRAADRRPSSSAGNGYGTADDHAGGRRASVRAQSTDGRLEGDDGPAAKTADAERKIRYGNAVGTGGRNGNVTTTSWERQPQSTGNAAERE